MDQLERVGFFSKHRESCGSEGGPGAGDNLSDSRVTSHNCPLLGQCLFCGVWTLAMTTGMPFAAAALVLVMRNAVCLKSHVHHAFADVAPKMGSYGQLRAVFLVLACATLQIGFRALQV